MASKKIPTHIPFIIFHTDTALSPSDETCINSPPASPTAFTQTSNTLGLVGVPVLDGQVCGTGHKHANEILDTADGRTQGPEGEQDNHGDNQGLEDGDLIDNEDDEEDQVLALVGLDLSRKGPPAILRHGAFVAPLPKSNQELPPLRHSLLNAQRRIGFIPFAMEQLGPETPSAPFQCAVGPSVAQTKTGKGRGLAQWPEGEADDLNDEEGVSALLATWAEEPESELEDEMLNCEEKILDSISVQTAVKRPSAPVLVQPRGDGQAEVRLVLEDEDGFLDDIEDYINGDFDMYSFGALSEMMGSPVKSTSYWIDQTGVAVASLDPGDMQRMIDLCPDRSPDAFSGLAEGEEAYRPPTPLGISESDEEDLNRPMSPSGDGDSDVTAVENVSSVSFGPSVPGTVDEVEQNAVDKYSAAATSPLTSCDSASSARSTSISPLVARPKVSLSRPRNAEKPVDTISPAASGRSRPSQRPSSSSSSPLTTSTSADSPSDVPRASTSQTATLKRKASDADLDETKDVKGKGKALESVKRQRLLLRKPSGASVESM